MRDKKGTHRFWGVLFYLALMDGHDCVCLLCRREVLQQSGDRTVV